MPRRAPLPCTAPRCPHLAVSEGRCPAHPRPPRPYGPGYGRTMPQGWDATRSRILDRDGHRCRRCGAEATDVDHVRRGGGEHDANLQSLCEPCHDAKSQAEAQEAARIARAGRAARGLPW
jgi:5-methylcytosine-specific restriction protein A